MKKLTTNPGIWKQIDQVGYHSTPTSVSFQKMIEDVATHLIKEGFGKYEALKEPTIDSLYEDIALLLNEASHKLSKS